MPIVPSREVDVPHRHNVFQEQPISTENRDFPRHEGVLKPYKELGLEFWFYWLRFSKV